MSTYLHHPRTHNPFHCIPPFHIPTPYTHVLTFYIPPFRTPGCVWCNGACRDGYSNGGSSTAADYSVCVADPGATCKFECVIGKGCGLTCNLSDGDAQTAACSTELFVEPGPGCYATKVGGASECPPGEGFKSGACWECAVSLGCLEAVCVLCCAVLCCAVLR